MPVTVKIIATSSQQCSKRLLESVEDDAAHSLLRCVIGNTTHKHAKVRGPVYEGLVIVLSKFAQRSQRQRAAGQSEPSAQDVEVYPMIADAIIAGLGDSGAPARTAARLCLIEFKDISEQHANHVLESMTTAQRRGFERELKSHLATGSKKGTKKKRSGIRNGRKSVKKKGRGSSLRSRIKMARKAKKKDVIDPVMVVATKKPSPPSDAQQQQQATDAAAMPPVAPSSSASTTASVASSVSGSTAADQGDDATKARKDSDSRASPVITITAAERKSDQDAGKRDDAKKQASPDDDIDDGSESDSSSIIALPHVTEWVNRQRRLSIDPTDVLLNRHAEHESNDDASSTSTAASVSASAVSAASSAAAGGDNAEDAAAASTTSAADESFELATDATVVVRELLDLERPRLTDKMLAFLDDAHVMELMCQHLSRLDGRSLQYVHDNPHFPDNNSPEELRPEPPHSIEDDRSHKVADLLCDVMMIPLLEKHLEVAVMHALAVFHPQSQGNLHHAATVASRLMLWFPKRVLQIVITPEGKALARLMFEHLHESSVGDCVLDFVCAGDHKTSKASLFKAMLNEWKLMDLLTHRICSPDEREETSSYNALFLVQFLDRLHIFRSSIALISSICAPGSLVDRLIETVCDEQHTHQDWQRTQCATLLDTLMKKSQAADDISFLPNASAHSAAVMKTPTKTTSSSSGSGGTENMLASKFSDIFPMLVKRIRPKVGALCTALTEIAAVRARGHSRLPSVLAAKNAEAAAKAASSSSASESSMPLKRVPSIQATMDFNDLMNHVKFSAFSEEHSAMRRRLAIMSVIVELSKGPDAGSLVSLIPSDTWTTLVDGFFEYRHNNAYLNLFMQLVLLSLRHKVHDMSISFIMVRCKLLKRMIEFYQDASNHKCSLHGYILELCNHLKFTADIQFETEFIRSFLSRSPEWQDFLPKLRSETIAQLHQPRHLSLLPVINNAAAPMRQSPSKRLRRVGSSSRDLFMTPKPQGSMRTNPFTRAMAKKMSSTPSPNVGGTGRASRTLPRDKTNTNANKRASLRRSLSMAAHRLDSDPSNLAMHSSPSVKSFTDIELGSEFAAMLGYTPDMKQDASRTRGRSFNIRQHLSNNK
eukprot:TRINITY_DN67589_c4_g2_i1.p1 TRINITY_DN67589_c4_g2~~TRINITY_DN67589_c4_g2_i1.p1  ORF type:complete len:1186 (-),score=631.35 TRINITY_DN67589_c4_g2_i1:89-3421(-)